MTFTCNACGYRNQTSAERFPREEPTCARCKSNVRVRGVLRALSLELFGLDLPITDFPRVKSLRGLGTSDGQYAERLAAQFDYRNTYYDREPRFDITREPPASELGAYDFVISSEVFEHV